jgi:DNA repair photolyase
MQSTKKDQLENAGRWLRVSILTLTTLAPIITPVISRVLSRLLDKPEESRRDGVSDKVSHELAKRSELARKKLAKRGELAKKELAKRGELARKKLAKRGELAKKELTKRGEWVKELAEQKKATWTALGFGLGLTVAGIVAFQLVRRRLLQQLDEEPAIQLPYDADRQPSVTSAVR